MTCQDYRLYPVSDYGVIKRGDRYLLTTYFPRESEDFGGKHHRTYQECQPCAIKRGRWPAEAWLAGNGS